MQSLRFGRKLGGDVALDICFDCQGIWFDDRESMQLTPAAVVSLFGMIHQHRQRPRRALANVMVCPRCDEGLSPLRDVVKHGRFNYLRCAAHGRFTVFSQFLVEKGFVRQVNAAEISRLRVDVVQLNCSACGAPVDLRKESACGYCQAPIVVLDADAVNKALADYLHRPVDLPSPVTAMARRPAQAPAAVDAGAVDLLLEGISSAWEVALS